MLSDVVVVVCCRTCFMAVVYVLSVLNVLHLININVENIVEKSTSERLFDIWLCLPALITSSRVGYTWREPVLTRNLNLQIELDGSVHPFLRRTQHAVALRCF